MTQTGVFVGNNPGDLAQFENWLGDEVDIVRIAGSRANWSDYVNTTGWLAHTWSTVDRDKHWTIPLFVESGNLDDAASGKYNGYYAAAAKKLIDESGAGSEPIIVRTGEELNGDWFPWAAKGREAQFVQAFQQFVKAFETVSGRFQFEWNVNIGDLGMDPAKAYPGDAYVDVIGMDLYYNTAWDSADPMTAWQYNVSRSYGLQWLEDFADAHGKPTAYSEWGVMSDTAGPYIEAFGKWVDSHDVVMHAYWNSHADYPGKLSDGSKPNAGAAYKATFADNAVAGPSPAESPAPVTILPAPPAESGSWATWKGGTAGNDSLLGDARNNSLDGMDGADTMTGAAGDDLYKVERAADRIVEGASAGVDSVVSYAAKYTLGANVENLALDATYAQTGIGNGARNRIGSNGAGDTLDGKGGDDWLTGGGGNDVFVFGKGGGKDVVTDFSAGDRVNLTAFGETYAEVQADMVQTGSDVLIGLGDGGSILLFNASVASLGASAFLL